MKNYNVTGMSCAACSARVEKAVSAVEGVASCSLPGLTTSAMRIDQLMTMLVDNAVGPVGLEDVIRDWL